jgi:gamma-glutamylcyclotransferase (GGCT)/AIG2-like uncharacterized protein YtfP
MARNVEQKMLVAVYGSLKKGFHNHCYFGPSDTQLGTGYVSDFAMFSMGGYPMIVPGYEQVRVEVYEVGETTFCALDALEGFPHFYDRKRVTVHLDNGDKVKAWIYFGRPEQVQNCPKVESGNWSDPYPLELGSA